MILVTGISFVPSLCLHNTKIGEVTLTSPFSLMLNRRANDFVDYTGTKVERVTVDNWKQHQEEVIALVFPAIEHKQIRMTQKAKDKFMKTRRNILKADLPPGMEVYIRDPEYEKGSPRPREVQRNIGPWTIVRRLYNGPYLLRDATGEFRTVPIDQLVVTRTNRRTPTPTDSDTDKLKSYEVEDILDHRYNDKGVLEYYITWKGYDSSHDTWEPIYHIDDSKLIKEYSKKKRAEALRLSTTLDDEVLSTSMIKGRRAAVKQSKQRAARGRQRSK